MNLSKANKFFLKCFFLTLPFTLILASYFYYDPGQVIRSYNDFNHVILVNRDYISTQTFINNNPKQQYQSFILGNSRSGAFYTADWARYIHDKNSFHFDASGESLYGVYHKMKFLDANVKVIKNVLFICDRGLLKNIGNPPGGPLFMKDSRASDNSWLEFQTGFIKAYFSDFYFINFLRRKYSAKVGIIDTATNGFIPISNDTPSLLDAKITNDSVAYYNEHDAYFKKQGKLDVSERNPVIAKKQLAMLQEIMRIFKKHNTDYRIVISPLLDKIPLNPNDVKLLQDVFGSNRVYDYSGSNIFTSNYRNYYEASHYRPHVARSIMKEIYSTPMK